MSTPPTPVIPSRRLYLDNSATSYPKPPEVLHVSDRILVMHEGRLTGEFSREQANEEVIMKAAIS